MRHRHPVASIRRSAAALVARAGARAAARRLLRHGEKPEEEVGVDPPDLLYNQGLALLNAGDTREATEKFETIDKEHPYSDYARRSMIMSAFLNFRRGKYQEAINDAQRYVTLFPASPDAAYAQYLIGESYFRQIPDVTRDQDLSQQGDRGDERGRPEISGFRICRRRAQEDRDGARPDRRQGDADRPLLSGAARISRRGQPLPHRGRATTRRRGTSRRRCTG